MNTAVARPAAPAPAIAMSHERESVEGRRQVYVAYAVVLGAWEIAPHALQRTMRLSPPSVLPMTSVR